MINAWRERCREKAARLQREANIYGAAFVGLFIISQIPGPSLMHYAAFFIGICCGSKAYGCWAKATGLRANARMELPELKS